MTAPLDELIEQVWPRCFAYAMHITRNRMDAEDMMQVVAVKVWTRYRGDLDERSVRAYFAKAIFNQFLDDLGKKQTQRLIVEPVVAFTDPMERQIANPDLIKGLRLLSPTQRRALWLKANGYSGIEAAELMNMTHAGYRQILHRSRSRMQQYLMEPSITAALLFRLRDSSNQNPSLT